jgi:hypothetical protein
MKHLTDEQLSAQLDRQLPAKAAEAADRHLAECAECRERLAALAGADASLARALDHDPGEAYFGTFAERVQARLAAGAVATSAPDPARAVRARWWNSPRALAWAGAAAVTLVAGTFAVQQALQHPRQWPSRAESPLVASDRLESREPAAAKPAQPAPSPAAQAPAGAPLAVGAPAEGGEARATSEPGAALDKRLSEPLTAEKVKSEALRKEALARDQAAAAPRVNEIGAPGRMQELKTLPSGEQVPVQPRALPQAEKQRTFAAPPGQPTRPSRPSRPAKPSAMPMTPAPALAEKRVAPTDEAHVRGGRADEAKAGLAGNLKAAPAPATTPAPAPAAPGVVQSEEAPKAALAYRGEEGTTFRLCGRVTSPQGMPLAGATVTVVESGRSVTSDADGTYCLDAPSPRATLSVLAVGYLEYRAGVRAEDAHSNFGVALKPVDALGPGGLPTARLQTPPAPATERTSSGTSSGSSWGATRSLYGEKDSKLTVPAQPGEAADSRLAREATELAMRLRSVMAWSRAGALWTSVAGNAKTDTAANEALYRAAEARMSAWRLARGSSNRRAAFDAVDAFLARAPAGARRETVEKWRKELPDR